MRVQVAPSEHYPWLWERTGLAPTAYFRALEAVDHSGAIRGMVGYDTWMNRTCFMHVALDSPVAVRTLLRPAFHSLFVDAGYEVAMGMVRQSNVRSRRLAERLGFELQHVIREGWSKDEHLFLYEMRRANCRWIEKGSAT